jgi:hypothetical protein
MLIAVVKGKFLALSIGPNRVDVLLPDDGDKTPVSETSCVFDQRQTMDNAQKVCHFNKTPSSQTFRIYHPFVISALLNAEFTVNFGQ